MVLIVAACGGGGGMQDGRGGDAASDGATTDALTDASSDGTWDAAALEPRRLAVAVVGFRDSIRVYAQTGTTFRKVFDQPDLLGHGSGITWADYDGDSLDDVVSSFAVPGMPGANEIVAIHNDGATGLSLGFEFGPGRIPVLHGFDADDDGDDDLYGGDLGNNDFLFRAANGAYPATPTWTGNVTKGDALAIDTGDLTGDGRPDIAIGRSGGETVMRGAPAAPQPMWSQLLPDDGSGHDVAIVDYDGDGSLEVSFAETNFSQSLGGVSVYRWQSDQMMLVTTLDQIGPVRSVGWADLDDDGDQDLAVCEISPSVLRVYRRDGETFTADPMSEPSCRRVRFGDLDADGDLDLVKLGDGLTIFRNDGGTLAPVFSDSDTADALALGQCGEGSTECFAEAPSL